MKKLNASKLRENIYQILDEIISSGIPVEIVRKGETLRIIPDKARSHFGKKKRSWIKGDLEDLVSMDWSKEWSETK